MSKRKIAIPQQIITGLAVDKIQKIPLNSREWRKNYRTAIPWSTEQLAFFDAVAQSDENIGLEAVAGSGKTTAIKGALVSVPSSTKIVVCVFNRANADKLRNDPCIPSNVIINTAHGFGKALLVRQFYGNQPIVERGKYTKIAKELVEYYLQTVCQEFVSDQRLLPPKRLEQKWTVPPPFFDERNEQSKADVKLFIKFIRNVAEYAMKTLTPLNFQDLEQMVEHFSLGCPDVDGAWEWGILMAKKALEIGEQKAREEYVINFDEMLYLPYIWGLTTAKKDILIVDEAQDASPAQRSLYENYVRQGARMIFVGDRRQAIQGFAGADAYSWQALIERFQPQLMPLSICFRCPRSHIELAQKIVPQIRPRPDAPEGVREVCSYERLLANADIGDLVVCRLSAPLIQTALKLIIASKPAKVRGREIGEALIALATKAGCPKVYPQGFKEQLWQYVLPRIKAATQEGDELEEELWKDKYLALSVLFDEFQCRTFSEFASKVENIFFGSVHGTDEEDVPKNLIICSTIHAAKGDEANTVYILGSNLLPFLKRVTRAWQEEQEWNLLYVALTRAKKNMYFTPFSRSKDDDQDALLHPFGGIQLPD